MQIPTLVLIVVPLALCVIALEFFQAFQAYRSRRLWEKFVEKHNNNNHIGE